MANLKQAAAPTFCYLRLKNLSAGCSHGVGPLPAFSTMLGHIWHTRRKIAHITKDAGVSLLEIWHKKRLVIGWRNRLRGVKPMKI